MMNDMEENNILPSLVPIVQESDPEELLTGSNELITRFGEKIRVEVGDMWFNVENMTYFVAESIFIDPKTEERKVKWKKIQ